MMVIIVGAARCLLIVTLLAALPAKLLAATSTSDTLQADTPAQILNLANQALATGGLSDLDKERILAKRGLAHEMLGQRNDAVSDFNEVVASTVLAADERAIVLYDRGVTLDELGRTDDAIADYTAALRF